MEDELLQMLKEEKEVVEKIEEKKQKDINNL